MTETQELHLKAGDPAPDFELLDQHGNTVRLSDYRGQKLLIYFYPKADTPDEQAAFDEKFSLGFPLLADEGGVVSKDYGVWGEPFGPGWQGVIRSSFLVDESGTLEHVWYKVSPTDTVPKAIEALV